MLHFNSTATARRNDVTMSRPQHDRLCEGRLCESPTYMLYMRTVMVGVQAMRFGASPAACRQAMSLGFTWSKQRLSSAAQEDMQRIEQHAEKHMQKVN